MPAVGSHCFRAPQSPNKTLARWAETAFSLSQSIHHLPAFGLAPTQPSGRKPRPSITLATETSRSIAWVLPSTRSTLSFVCIVCRAIAPGGARLTLFAVPDSLSPYQNPKIRPQPNRAWMVRLPLEDSRSLPHETIHPLPHTQPQPACPQKQVRPAKPALSSPPRMPPPQRSL